MARAMESIEVEFSPRDREIFAMNVGQERSASETAAALNVPITQVYQAKSRILARLSALVAAQIEEEG
jgi:DNA-directed RNA polymerase specialized sigma24 family protein